MGVPTPEVSVIVPFDDSEEIIGLAVRRLHTFLSGQGWGFEIVAVDQGSRDNSRSLLALLTRQLPELRFEQASSGAGFSRGATRACGRVLWLCPPDAALGPVSTLSRALRRIRVGETDAVVFRRFCVCSRSRTLRALQGLRGEGPTFHRALAARCQALGLTVDIYGSHPVTRTRWPGFFGALRDLAATSA